MVWFRNLRITGRAACICGLGRSGMRFGLAWVARASAALALCAPLAGRATCTLSGPLGGGSTHDNSAAPIPFGRVNLDNVHLQPPGTLLAATVVPPTNFTHRGAHADSVLWQCEHADLKELYFLVSTNGDDRVGGYVDVSSNGDPGLSDVHATWFAYVGIKLIMEDVVLSRWYQKVPLTHYDLDEKTNKILIRLRHLPVLRAELYRISKLPPRGQRDRILRRARHAGNGIRLVRGHKLQLQSTQRLHSVARTWFAWRQDRR